MKSMTNSLGPSRTRMPVEMTPRVRRSGTRAEIGWCWNCSLKVPLSAGGVGSFGGGVSSMVGEGTEKGARIPNKLS